MNKFNNKIIIILGPTSSGKSDVAIRLAKKLNGEIISADSRQIYRGLDIGTGKIEAGQSDEIPQIFTSSKSYAGSRRNRNALFISGGVWHHMIDILSPRSRFSAAQFRRKANKIITAILKQGKLPIICGGTGFWIKSIVDDIIYPEVKPDWKLRKELNKKSATELFKALKKLDPQRSKNIDRNNKVRLIRAIEICKKLGKVPVLFCHCEGAKQPRQSRDCRASLAKTNGYQFLQIGIKLTKEKLHKNIKKRLKQRFDAGMIQEVKKLKKQGLPWKKIQNFGLGYFWIPKYLKGEIKAKDALFEKIYQAEKNYAKRQMTWFQKDKRIKWIGGYKNIEKEINKFINN
jgi:tRNA dimethylallyltransferase